jgi:hypothetical protein
VQNSLSVNISDSLNAFTCDSIYVPSGSSLTIANTVPEYTPEINIRGNININGSLVLGNSISSYQVNLNGTNVQNISGNGHLQFPENGVLIISNNIQLLRNLTVNCSVNQLAEHYHQRFSSHG